MRGPRDSLRVKPEVKLKAGPRDSLRVKREVKHEAGLTVKHAAEAKVKAKLSWRLPDTLNLYLCPKTRLLRRPV